MSSALTVLGLQSSLAQAGFYAGTVDGDFGPNSRAALDAAMRSGSHFRLSPAAIAEAAKRLLLTPAHIGACYDVESTGHGFDADTAKPVIRFEPHIFQKLTKGKFDGVRPDLSHAYSQRNLYPQPASQSVRWDRLGDAIALDADAAFSATSYGLFQVMGFNAAACGYPDVWTFVQTMASGEAGQLNAFCGFLKSEGLIDKLRRGDWAGYAARYNGPGYDDAPGRGQDYDVKLQRAYEARGGK